MRKVTKEYELYTFDELDESTQEKVIERNYDYNVDYDWWNHVTDYDAVGIGLMISEFDIDRRTITGDFVHHAQWCAQAIITNHGDACETYATAKAFINEYLSIEMNIEKYWADTLKDDVRLEGLECHKAELESEFLHDILEDYLVMLRREYEYLTSREAIIESILSNECEFLKDGTPFFGV